MSDAKSTTEEKVVVRINPTTSTGKPSKIDGKAKLNILTGGATASMASDDEIAADIAAGKPGLVGYLVSEDAPGISTWEIRADVDLGEAVEEIVDGGTYSYNDPKASNLGVVTGEVLPK